MCENSVKILGSYFRFSYVNQLWSKKSNFLWSENERISELSLTNSNIIIDIDAYNSWKSEKSYWGHKWTVNITVSRFWCKGGKSIQVYARPIQLCLIWKYSVKGVSKKLYHIVHYFIITSFNLLMVTKVLTSCFNFRRPATYLIIASQIVRPSSIYQVGEPCISCMMLWKPDFCVNWHEILYKFTVNFIFQISGCLHFLVLSVVVESLLTKIVAWDNTHLKSLQRISQILLDLQMLSCHVSDNCKFIWVCRSNAYQGISFQVKTFCTSKNPLICISEMELKCMVEL